MFCPICSTQNEAGRGYCRQCGLSLGGVRLAVSGRAGEALSRYKKGGGALSAGAAVLVVCVLIAILNFFLSSEPRNYGTLINLLVGLAVALPMIIVGMARLSRAGAALNDGDATAGQVRGQVGEPASLPPDTRKLDPVAEGLAESLTAGNTVTEQTTLKLKRR
jgi:hypothetical protein